MLDEFRITAGQVPPADLLSVYVELLSVDTEPVKGEVFVDGPSWGTAPQIREVGAGVYTVTFGDVPGYIKPADQQVTVESEQDASIIGTYTPTPVTLEVTPDSHTTTDPLGSSTTFDVSNAGGGTMPWTAEVDPADTWLTIASGASGTDSGTIAVSFFSYNNTESDRVGTITVEADGAIGSPKQVTVTQIYLLPGDATRDGTVDLADYARLEVNFGMTGVGWDEADFTGEGSVDLADYAIMEINFGRTTSGQSASGVAVSTDEPNDSGTSLPCMGLGLILILCIFLGFGGLRACP